MAMYQETQRTTETDVEEPIVTEKAEYGMSVAARIIYFVGTVIIALLGIRFLLALLGTNSANAFADFIYTVSYPFVAPFFGLFGYNVQYGVSKVEVGTLVAMLVYALVMVLLVQLVTIGSRRTRV